MDGVEAATVCPLMTQQRHLAANANNRLTFNPDHTMRDGQTEENVMNRRNIFSLSPITALGLSSTRKKIYVIVAVLAAFYAASCEVACAEIIVSQTGPLITNKCSDGKATEGCSWCSARTGKCYVVTNCTNGKCTVLPFQKGAGPIKVKGGTAAPIINGKPVEAPPPKGSNPINAAPITSGMPTHASPGGSGGGKLK